MSAHRITLSVLGWIHGSRTPRPFRLDGRGRGLDLARAEALKLPPRQWSSEARLVRAALLARAKREGARR
jgi:hypothetical protein